MTAASVGAFVVADLLFSGAEPLLAPLTALLVVQLTPVSLLASGLDRVLSVVAGVTVAVVFSVAVELTWWSLGIVIALSLTIGQVLRLGSNLLEVPISAMLVLGVGSFAAESAAGQRIGETLVGAGVGVASNLILPPKVRTQDAGTAIEDLADDLAALLELAARECRAPFADPDAVTERAARWLGEARRLTHDIPNVGQALLRAEESRRLNLRAVGTADPTPGLRQGLEALEHAAVAVRSMFRSLLDATTADDWSGEDGEAGGDGDDAVPRRGLVAPALEEFAAALRAFGRLVRAEARSADGAPGELADLQAALEGLREAQARLTELVVIDDHPVHSELDHALLATTKRLLREFDLQERRRRQRAARPSPLRRRLDRAATRMTAPRAH